MQRKNFIITELRIHEKCSNLYKKVLKSKTYQFNQLNISGSQVNSQLAQEIYGKRIFIQTIVGKNGSGKSSILELMYRIINNFSYYILSSAQPRRVAAEPVYLIEEIFADLDFIIDGQKCCLMVRHKSLAFICGNEKFYFGEFHDDFEGCLPFTKEKSSRMIELASTFFYTIVTNYSFQSLISKDFEKDIAKDFIRSKKLGTGSNGNWLDSLFHKNDGYITPIVLNPYRRDGVIDVQREYFLTLSRISALLIDARKRKKEFLAGYQLNTINYLSNHAHFIGKLFKDYNDADDPIYLSTVAGNLRDERSVAYHIINAYGLMIPAIRNENDVVPYAYLIYKTISVLDKYAQFEEYKNIPKATEFSAAISDDAKVSLTKAIDEIKTHRSHVNIKIFQTINYIGAYDKLIDKFILEDYLPFQNLKSFSDLDELIEHLPPPFYEQDVRLGRLSDPGSDLPVSSLSSGERQFVYTVSTIVYHIKNLLSIQQSNRIRYRNINIVLDEVEICFHPEYQRQFISQLIELIERLNLTRNCSYNILIVTHSPFILSDVPKSNILYLEEGRQFEDEKMIDPFAANINDILYQSFFLSGGFIGEHAKKIINEAVEVLVKTAADKKVNKNTIWDQSKLKQLIDMIGEPLLKDNLADLYRQAFKQVSYQDQLTAKDKEIEQLKKRLEERPND
jgi:predicted ATPase